LHEPLILQIASPHNGILGRATDSRDSAATNAWSFSSTSRRLASGTALAVLPRSSWSRRAPGELHLYLPSSAPPRRRDRAGSWEVFTTNHSKIKTPQRRPFTIRFTMIIPSGDHL